MATSYIGARYVPAFYENPDGTNDWSSTATYEPLTIVSYNSSYYVSKKQVPAGDAYSPINTNYWVLNGSGSGDVTALQKQVNDLETEYDTYTANNDTNIISLQTRVSALETSLSNYETSNDAVIATIQTNISTLETALNEYKTSNDTAVSAIKTSLEGTQTELSEYMTTNDTQVVALGEGLVSNWCYDLMNIYESDYFEGSAT